jgi:hypothetical protein
MRLLRWLSPAFVAAALSACGQAAPEPASEPGAAPLPNVAQIVCRAGGTDVLTPTVRPQPDGVHLDVQNETGSELAFKVEDREGGGGGFDIPGSSVMDLHPGKARVACFDGYREDPSEIPGEPLEIVDEDGVWVSSLLDCPEAVSEVADYAEDAQGEQGDPAEIVRRYATDRDLAGNVERAGYVQGETPVFRLVSEGDVVASVELFADGEGGWLVSSVDRCSG